MISSFKLTYMRAVQLESDTFLIISVQSFTISTCTRCQSFVFRHDVSIWYKNYTCHDHITQIASPAGIWAGQPRLPGPSPSGQTAGVLLVLWADPGPARAGPGWESTGLALARTNPIVPRVAWTNPAWDQSRLAAWLLWKIYNCP